jgi:hypothetical protein
MAKLTKMAMSSWTLRNNNTNNQAISTLLQHHADVTHSFHTTASPLCRFSNISTRPRNRINNPNSCRRKLLKHL